MLIKWRMSVVCSFFNETIIQRNINRICLWYHSCIEMAIILWYSDVKIILSSLIWIEHISTNPLFLKCLKRCYIANVRPFASVPSCAGRQIIRCTATTTTSQSRWVYTLPITLATNRTRTNSNVIRTKWCCLLPICPPPCLHACVLWLLCCSVVQWVPVYPL